MRARRNAPMTASIAPFGTWASPIDAAQAGAAANSLTQVSARAGRLYWIEARASEGGRNVLVAEHAGGGVSEITPVTHNVRTTVHEYGGRAYAHVGAAIVFSNFTDQRLYLQDGAAAPRPLTPSGYRYADGVAAADETLYCVREDHTQSGEPKNTIVALSIAAASTPSSSSESSAGQVLYEAADFVAYPRLSQDGRHLAFISWNHPDMPFDATTLHVGALGANGLGALQTIAGAGQSRESVLEPQWDRDGSLYFLSDRSGYWNLYRWRDRRIETITSFDADLGGPLWQLGAATYALTGDGRALARVCRDAVDELVLIDLTTKRITPFDLPFVSFGSIGLRDPDTAYAVGAAADDLAVLFTLDLGTGATTVVRRAGTLNLAADSIARAKAIAFPTVPGSDGQARSAHAFLYPPCNPNFRAPAADKPPLIVLLHGGPTAHAVPVLRLDIQFWTTRGFAVASVNYGGSSGFGRAYRERLRGQWGVVDLQDAVAAVDFLVAQGRVDPGRIAIRGGSAGGFTVLSALAFTDRFDAGINYYGVADAEALAHDTHKFESRYCDSLIAPLPEGIEVYRARSPIRHLEGFRTPLITFQGDEDRAVPPSQSRAIVAALRSRGVPVAYLEFKGEQHGFRDARNVARALEAELYFLGRIFGFAPADNMAPIEIENL